MTRLRRHPAVVFSAFAFSYFFAALLRAITATLAPVFSAELGLRAADLGLLAGAFFFGFAAMQLPLGVALDRVGPRRTLLALLTLAVLGCAGFAGAPNLPALIAARVLTGAGLAGCLMAALTCYRQLWSAPAQLRANSWMLMSGSLGMLASTVPVQVLLPTLGWRGLFWGVAALLLLAMTTVAWLVPRDAAPATQVDLGSAGRARSVDAAVSAGYVSIVRHPRFLRTAPLGFFVYGGLIAVQSLWAGPWLTGVAGWSAAEAGQGLFIINLAMLLAFMGWGALMPRLARHGVSALALMRWGLPLPLVLLLCNVALGSAAGSLHWAAWCVACTFVSVGQPAVGALFPEPQTGRALSAFNLVIFSGVFCIQWGLGLLIDALRAQGLTEADAFRGAFLVFWACSAAAYGWFWHGTRQAIHNPR